MPGAQLLVDKGDIYTMSTKYLCYVHHVIPASEAERLSEYYFESQVSGRFSMVEVLYRCQISSIYNWEVKTNSKCIMVWVTHERLKHTQVI